MKVPPPQHVSDKENCFNRLCAIILAKLIDEEKVHNAILDFQWFPNKDTAEDLIDRLQRLYKRGMMETLGEDVTYFEEKDIDRAFIAHRSEIAKNEVKKIFRALKFYTNSDFAFKEVHNKKLFEQNARSTKGCELFQGYRLIYTSKQPSLETSSTVANSVYKQSEDNSSRPPHCTFIVRCCRCANAWPRHTRAATSTSSLAWWTMPVAPPTSLRRLSRNSTKTSLPSGETRPSTLPGRAIISGGSRKTTV